MITGHSLLTKSDSECDVPAKEGAAKESKVKESAAKEGAAKVGAAHHRGGVAECCDTDVRDKVR